MGAEIDKRFNTREELRRAEPNFYKKWITYPDMHSFMACIVTGRVINLVTKGRYYEKPTYKSLYEALILMKIKFRFSKNKKMTKVAMPLIGCGLDRLQWNRVSAMIKDIFADTDIEILVCKR